MWRGAASRRPGAVLLGALVVALVACAPAREAQLRGDGAIRVMSFNLRYASPDDGEDRWERRKDLAVAVLRRHHADVLGLQEALRSQLDDLRAALPVYREVGRARDDGGTKGEYAAILYRKDRFELDESGTFWLSDTPELPGSITWGNACTRVCTWARLLPRSAGRPFYVLNVHLDHVSQFSREKGVALIVSRIVGRAHPDPVILTGDFNVTESNAVIRYLTGDATLEAAPAGMARNPLPLVDTFRARHSAAARVGTFHAFKGERTGERIDYIFCQPDAIVRDAGIVRDSERGRFPSDHFPVIATLCFRHDSAR